jgi:prevent-host-death family protein
VAAERKSAHVGQTNTSGAPTKRPKIDREFEQFCQGSGASRPSVVSLSSLSVCHWHTNVLPDTFPEWVACQPLHSLAVFCYNVVTLLHQRLQIMAITKLSSRDFNQDTSRAKRAAKRGPVFITDRGRPSHVLLTMEEYQRLTGGEKSIADLLAMPAAAKIEFEPPRLKGNLHEPADLT